MSFNQFILIQKSTGHEFYAHYLKDPDQPGWFKDQIKANKLFFSKESGSETRFLRSYSLGKLGNDDCVLLWPKMEGVGKPHCADMDGLSLLYKIETIYKDTKIHMDLTDNLKRSLNKESDKKVLNFLLKPDVFNFLCDKWRDHLKKKKETVEKIKNTKEENKKQAEHVIEDIFHKFRKGDILIEPTFKYRDKHRFLEVVELYSYSYEVREIIFEFNKETNLAYMRKIQSIWPINIKRLETEYKKIIEFKEYEDEIYKRRKHSHIHLKKTPIGNVFKDGTQLIKKSSSFVLDYDYIEIKEFNTETNEYSIISLACSFFKKSNSMRWRYKIRRTLPYDRIHNTYRILEQKEKLEIENNIINKKGRTL